MEFAATVPLLAGVQESAADQLFDFEALLWQHKLRVFRFFLASTRDKDVAETLTQDCFFKAYNARLSFRGECSTETWLLQIAVNLVRDHARNRRLQFWRRTTQTAHRVEGLREWLSDGKQSLEAEIVLKQQVNAVWAAAAHLPERQKTVFLLRFVEDMDLNEIAAATGMKEGTVKTHLFRALQAIRQRMSSR